MRIFDCSEARCCTLLARRTALRLFVLTALLWLSSCGGGRDGAPDILATEVPRSQASGADTFLLFVNPQNQGEGGSPPVNSEAYARAYYAAIDPDGSRNTLAKWKAANRLDQPVAPDQGQETVVFGDQRDLGYGRRMTARYNSAEHIAVLVENYQADPGGGYGYTPLNVQAAVSGAERWRVAYNAIEYSTAPGGAVPFAKFYSFDAKTGEQILVQDLDGRGPKALPGACLSCHGGRADGLVRGSIGDAFKMRVAGDTASKAHGDVQGKLHALEVDTFDFAAVAGFSRAEQENKLKRINRWVLCTYPLPALQRGLNLTEDACRRTAQAFEWQGGADGLIKQGYGGPGLPNTQYASAAVPTDWVLGGHTDLYQEVVGPYCRGCHLLRGTGEQKDVDFSTLAAFRSYAQRSADHVFNRGDMPASKLVYDAFVRSSRATQLLADALQGWGASATDAGGRALVAGRPIADPGPDRVVLVGQSVPLSAKASRFASSFVWRLESTQDASLTETQNMQSQFLATRPGTYKVSLQVSGPGGTSAARTLTVEVKNPVANDPAANLKSDWVMTLFAAPTGPCAACHTPDPLNGVSSPALLLSGLDATRAFDEFRSRINFDAPAYSPLLTKPAGLHHGGLVVDSLDALGPGSALTARQLLQEWVLTGAPR